jgi:alkylation response protein AidB-like acyl-CoA dehydrogenase
MDFTFSPDTVMLRDMLRRFVQKEARPLEMKYFNTGELTPEERSRLRLAIQQLGLWGLTVPEEFGGGGLDVITSCVVEEELGGTFIPVEMGEVPAMLYACNEEQTVQYLEPALEAGRQAIIAAREPGPQAVQPEAWQTTADLDGDQYILNGQKTLASSPTAQDFFVVYARAPQGLTAFLIEPGHPGVSISTNGRLVLSLADCRLPASSILGKPGGALLLGAENAPRAWIQTGARYIGIAGRLLEMASEHARDWVSLGAPLSARPAIQRMIADLQVDIESTRWMVYHAAWLADSGKQSESRHAAAQVRLASGEMLKRSIDRATMIFTGPGPSPAIEPNLMVKNLVPFDALEISMENARLAIATELLKKVEA